MAVHAEPGAARGRARTMGKLRFFLASRWARALAAFALLVLAGAWVPTAGRASVTEAVTVEQLALESSVVVVGTVEDTEAHRHGPGGRAGIHTRVTVRVSQAVAGTPDDELRFWVHGGRIGDRMRIVHGQARFVEGERVLLFLFRDPSEVLWPTALARGKWHLSEADGRLQAWPSAPLEGDHADVVRASSAHEALPLAQIVRRVRRVAGDVP